MTKTMYSVAVAMIACLAVTTAVSAKNLNSTKAPRARKTDLSGKDHVLMEIAGPTDSAAAEAFQKSLTASGLQAKLQPNKKGGKPIKVLAAVDSNTDLSPWSKAIASAIPTKRGQSAPALDLLVYAQLTKENSSQVTSELAKVKGIDAKNSSVDSKHGVVHVRISGTDKVTAADVAKALQAAGITPQTRDAAKAGKSAKTNKTT